MKTSAVYHVSDDEEGYCLASLGSAFSDQMTKDLATQVVGGLTMQTDCLWSYEASLVCDYPGY